MTACAGTFCAAGPALRRAKGSPDEFSILEAVRLLAHSSWNGVEQGHHALEVVYLQRRACYIQSSTKLVITIFHVFSTIHG